MVLKPEEAPAAPPAQLVQQVASSDESRPEARLSVLPQVHMQLSLDEQLPKSA